MATSNEAYVSQREGAYWVAGTRVSLDSIVYGFLNGETAESIAQSFPVLDLEQVYGAITFYLANRADIDAYLREGQAEYERLREAARQADPAFYQKLAEARQRICRDELGEQRIEADGCEVPLVVEERDQRALRRW